MNNISILIIIVLFVLTGFNTYYLCYFWRKTKKEGKIEEKDNYYKLDAKIELQKYLAIGLIAIAAFFGYAKFSDISENLKEVDLLNKNILKIESNLETLEDNYNNLANRHKTFNDETDIDFKKIDTKINNAAKRIPENNLRLLAKDIVYSRIEYVKNIGRWDQKGYSKNEIQDEINKSIESLVRLGFDEKELKQIRNNLEKDIDLLKF